MDYYRPRTNPYSANTANNSAQAASSASSSTPRSYASYLNSQSSYTSSSSYYGSNDFDYNSEYTTAPSPSPYPLYNASNSTQTYARDNPYYLSSSVYVPDNRYNRPKEPNEYDPYAYWKTPSEIAEDRTRERRRERRHDRRERGAGSSKYVVKQEPTEAPKVEAEPKIEQSECVSCRETMATAQTVSLDCGHRYCGSCIAASFQSAMTSRSPFKCCGQSVRITLAAPWLASAFIITYNFMLLEQSTPKPRYCSNTECLRFIPTSNIKGQVATCKTCWSTTCTLCGKADHKGVSEEDLAGKAVEILAKEQGWKSCPKCCQIIQRTEGCLHMTCRCTAEFCFRCLNDWKACGSQCSE